MTVTEYHKLLRQGRCIITGRPNPTLHHCHGGSLRREYPHLKRGGAQKTSGWLVIPLDASMHFGQFGIDTTKGVLEWESVWGKQTIYLQQLCERYNIDVFELAKRRK